MGTFGQTVFALWLVSGIASIVASLIDKANQHTDKRKLVVALCLSAGNGILSVAVWPWSPVFPFVFSLMLCIIPAVFQARQLINFDAIKAAREEAAKKEYENSMVFYPSRQFGVIQIDDDKKCFIMLNSDQSETAFRFDDLLGANLVEIPGNGKTKEPHRIRRAVVGGILAGGAGAVVGSMTGKEQRFPTISSLYISVSTTSGNVRISFASTELKTDGLIYKKSRQAAEETMAGLDTIMSEQSKAEPASSGDVTDEIRKYKSLLDDGIISQDEFDAKKKALLGL